LGTVPTFRLGTGHQSFPLQFMIDPELFSISSFSILDESSFFSHYGVTFRALLD